LAAFNRETPHGRRQEASGKHHDTNRRQGREAIERVVAAARRTTPAQVARVLLEDAAEQLALESQAA
jgi:hypothetical protein